MTQQLLTQSVDENAPGYKGDTSAEAFAKVKLKVKSIKENIIHAVLQDDVRGLTRSEIVKAVGGLDKSINRRVDELVKAGKLRGDKSHTRTNSRNNNEIVYHIGNGTPVASTPKYSVDEYVRILKAAGVSSGHVMAFVWDKTPEGADFWDKVWTALRA